MFKVTEELNPMIDCKAEHRIKEFMHNLTLHDFNAKKKSFSELLRKKNRENFIAKKRLIPQESYSVNEYPTLKVHFYP